MLSRSRRSHVALRGTITLAGPNLLRCRHTGRPRKPAPPVTTTLRPVRKLMAGCFHGRGKIGETNQSIMYSFNRFNRNLIVTQIAACKNLCLAQPLRPKKGTGPLESRVLSPFSDEQRGKVASPPRPCRVE